jgi:DNA-binding CsgD family transcriptional regulator
VARILCPALIGRSRETARLNDAIQAGFAGRGGVLFVAGPAGIGKSRLVAGAVEAKATGARVLLGRAVPSEVPEPYRPLTEALVAESPKATLLTSPALRGFRVALGRLVPAWREDIAAGADESPVVVAEALLRVLRAFATGSACVIVIEDLHWADPETLRTVEYLADHATESRVLCVGTLRDDPGTAAMELLGRLEARRAIEVIRLEPLSTDDVAQMARQCLAAETLPIEVHTMLRDRAEGVPFFVEELLAAAASSGALVHANAGWAVSGPIRSLVPESIAQTVHRRLAATGASGRRLLGTAALFGRSFDWRLAARAAECTPSAAGAVLEQAVALQLLATHDDGFSFRHALTREAILGGLLPDERADLAVRSLAALRQTAVRGDQWRHLAADLAEIAGDLNGAAVHLLDAGRASLRRGALATSTAALERADRLAIDASTHADVAESLAEARSAAGDVEGTRSAVAVLLDRLDTINAPAARRGQAHLMLARSAVTATRFALASEELARARRLGAAANDGALAARVTAVSAQLAIGEGRLGEAEALALRAVADATATGQPDVACEALEVAGRCARMRDLAESAEIAAQTLQVADAHGLALWRMRALYQIGIVEMFSVGGVDTLSRARDEAERLGAVATAAHLDLEIGAGLEMQGRSDEARDAFTHCAEMAHVLGLRGLEAMAHAFIASVEAERCARRSMEQAIHAALAVGGDDPEVVGAIWGDARAVASLADEDRPRARQELERAITAFGAREAPIPRPCVALRALLAAIDGGTPDPAPQHGATPALSLVGGYLAFTEAVHHGRAGRRREAEEAAQRGNRLLAGTPWYWHLTRRLCAESAIAGGWGDPGGWLHEAAQFFEGTGNVRLASACRGLLRRSGSRVARPIHAAKALPAGLRASGVTRREAEVLDLVGAGLSNSDIAERLFVSKRTVEQHVGWLKRKLEVESRAQLVAYAAGSKSGAP